MLTNEFKVISDNGLKVEIIRQMRDNPLRLGARVTLEVIEESGTAREIFDSVLSDASKEKILNEAKEALTPKVSKK